MVPCACLAWEDPNSKLEVRFLWNVYHFPTVLRWKIPSAEPLQVRTITTSLSQAAPTVSLTHATGAPGRYVEAELLSPWGHMLSDDGGTSSPQGTQTLLHRSSSLIHTAPHSGQHQVQSAACRSSTRGSGRHCLGFSAISISSS